jgi:hypothetical protein
MKITKNKKRIDPRYFLDETAMSPHQPAGEHVLHDEVVRIYCERAGPEPSEFWWTSCEDFARCLLNKIINDVELSDPIHRGGGPWTTETLLEEMERVVMERGTHAARCEEEAVGREAV